LSRLQTQDLAGSSSVQTKSAPTDNQMLLGHMCKSRPPFDDLKVRQALNYATDRADFDDKLYGGQGEEMWGWFSQDSINAAPALDGYYDTNVKKAKKLLADAGQSDLAFDLYFSPGAPDSETGAQIAQQQWAKAGITVTLKPLTNVTEFLPDATGAPMWFFPLQRAGVSKVSRILGPGSIGNVCNWNDPKLNALIIEAQGLPDGSEELAKVWRDISQQTFETAADVFVVFGTQNYAWNKSTVAKIPVYDGRLGTPEVYFWGATMK
jgi:peptide/nickel transport system substrate-binding protein